MELKVAITGHRPNKLGNDYDLIDSTSGLAIGNYLSSYLANFYLCYFDHWIKEQKKQKYYFRYCDDIVVLHRDKNYLSELRGDIINYLRDELKLTVKSNHQIFPIASRGLDFLGYKTFHTHSLVRKRIKKNFAKATNEKELNKQSINSYKGWLSHCNAINLTNTHLTNKPLVQCSEY